MKQIDYRYLTIFIIISVTVSIATVLLYRPSEKTKPAITINKKIISGKKFNTMFSKKSLRQDMDGFINSVITKELLIQEALKAGIANEESFRQSIQDYYEQALIKILMDRKYDSLKPEIDDSFTNSYIELSDKIVHLTLITYKKKEDLDKKVVEKQDTYKLPFNNLSTEVKYMIIQLKEGEHSNPEMSYNDSRFSVFRLDKVETAEGLEKEKDHAFVNKMLLEQKKELIISKWLDKLKQNADVSIATDVTPGLHKKHNENEKKNENQ